MEGRRVARLSGSALAGIVALGLWLSASAGAAVVSGSNLSQAPNNATCSAVISPSACTLTVAGLPEASRAPGGVRAGISGVIVGWKIRVSAPVVAAIRLRVVRGTTGAGTGPSEAFPVIAGIHSFPARLPVQAGDEIGLDAEVSPPYALPVIRSDAPGASFSLWSPPLADGDDRDPTSPGVADAELLMNVTIEPDPDGDGYGNETQDPCPTAANVLPPCPVQVQPPPAPNTKIVRGPKGRIGSRRATFHFRSEPAGGTFRCKLDKLPYRPCASPKTYKNLAPGKHRFRVRAESAAGPSDPTPAKRSFRVAR